MNENEFPGMVFCPEHREWERIDDRIDFPCSDDWLRYYHNRGLTYRCPDPVEEIRHLENEIANLRVEIAALRPRTIVKEVIKEVEAKPKRVITRKSVEV